MKVPLHLYGDFKEEFQCFLWEFIIQYITGRGKYSGGLSIMAHKTTIDFDTFHITPEAPLSALKSAIAKNGIGVTSRP